MLLTFGAQLLRPADEPRGAETRRDVVRPTSERTGKEINLAQFVFSNEELAERRAARQGSKSIPSAYHLRTPDETAGAAQIVTTKRGTRIERRAVSNAYLYRTKNAWKRDDIDGDGRGWGSQHPRTLSLPFH
jgi:hypothetical protein